MLRPLCALAITLVVLYACKKETIQPALPPDPATTELRQGVPPKADSIHGYFFAGYNFTRIPNNGTANSHTVDLSLYAQFIDPADDLTRLVNRKNGRSVTITQAKGNVGMSDVTYNNYYLNTFNSQAPMYYVATTGEPALIDYRAKWAIKGNDFIAPFEEVISNAYPVFKDSTRVSYFSVSKGFTVDPHVYFDSWDSIVVELSNRKQYYYLANPGYNTHRSGGASLDKFVFSPKELDFFLNDQDGRLHIRAFRYFNKTIQGRRYIFEFSTGVENLLYIGR